MRFNDAVSGFVIILVALFGLYLVSQFPDYPGERFGPGLFPALTLGTMLLCGAILVARGVQRRRIEAALTLDSWAREPRHLATLCLLGGAVVFYVMFSHRLGFPIAGFLVVFTLLVWMRGWGKSLRSALIAALAASAIFFVFARTLRVPLPLGFLTDLLY